MEVYVNEINGLKDAVCSLYLSKRNLTREREEEIRSICDQMIIRGSGEFIDVEDLLENMEFVDPTQEWTDDDKDQMRNVEKEFKTLVGKLTKYGKMHTTLLRYIDFSCSVYGLHRGAQDDFDAHAKRLENRIVRSSTRLAKYGPGEKSDFYNNKILTTDEVLDMIGIKMNDSFEANGHTYVKTVNGYVQEEYKDDKDVLRGLYMLSIPSNFIFKCNIVEFAHIVAMRDKNSHAAPELRDMIESILEQLNTMTRGMITREFLYEIERWSVEE